MPRPKSAVKNKLVNYLITPGIVDLHFHGAFGIDLMTAQEKELNSLARRLWKQGIAAFCPTTLSSSHKKLIYTVNILGKWIRSEKAQQLNQALPLGIHLEGPYLNSAACGAHPSSAIRSFQMRELEDLWEASQHTLKILTLAPETLGRSDLNHLVQWSKARKITLSIGHSYATQKEADLAFYKGFSGVTHAWNALSFHHRSPGVLGAALGRKGVYVELILDQVHLDPQIVHWTRLLHPSEAICFVSDCAPATATRAGSWHCFGDLKITFSQGACRLKNGKLAGGGILLSEAYSRWLRNHTMAKSCSLVALLRESIGHLTLAPLRALRISPQILAHRRVQWLFLSRNLVRPFPVD